MFWVNMEKPSVPPHKSKSMENVAKNLQFGSNIVNVHLDESDNAFIFDASREEVIIITQCKIAKNVPGRRFLLMKMKGAISVAMKSEEMYVMEEKNSERTLKRITYKFPKKPSKTNYILSHTSLVSISLSTVEKIKSIFYVPFDHTVGCYGEDNSVSMISLKSKVVEKVSTIDAVSHTEPYVSKDGKLLCTSPGQITLYALSLSVSDQKQKKFSVKQVKQLQVDGRVHVSCLFGNTVMFVRQHGNLFSLMEWGGLEFARRFCEAVMLLYRAIDYKPPNSGILRATTLDECIVGAEACFKVLSEMKENRLKLYPGNTSFYGCHGTPWTATITCLEKTVESWKVLKRRAEILQAGSSSKILAHAVGNESYVEHSFGFVKKSGQGHNESMEEYIVSKRKHMVDFQMRMSKLPFNQHVKTKLRDKGYQTLESRQVPMSLKEFKEIFSYAAPVKINQHLRVTDDCQQVLKKARLLSKHVPRQSSRTKWRADSGQTPTMITDNSSSGCLYKNDMVFYSDISGNLQKLVIAEDYLLNDSSIPLKVTATDNNPMEIMVDKLVLDGQQILTIPADLYNLNEGEVVLSEAYQPVLDTILGEVCRIESGYSEEDWSALLSVQLTKKTMDSTSTSTNTSIVTSTSTNTSIVTSTSTKTSIVTSTNTKTSIVTSTSTSASSSTSTSSSTIGNTSTRASNNNNNNNCKNDYNEVDNENNNRDILFDIEFSAESIASSVSSSNPKETIDHAASSRSSTSKRKIPQSSRPPKNKKKNCGTASSVDTCSSDDVSCGISNDHSDLVEVPFDKRALLSWVKVIYEGEVFLGKIIKVSSDYKCEVRCLEKPFGTFVGEMQDLEPEKVCAWYEHVYQTDVSPVMVQESSEDGKIIKRGKYRYVYGRKTTS